MARPKTILKSLPEIGKFFEHFWPYVRRERILIAGGLTALLTQTVLRLLEPWPLKFVIDEIVKSENVRSGTELPVVGYMSTETVLIIAAIALVAVTGLRAATGYWSKISFAVAGNRVLTKIRLAVFQHLQLLSLDYHQRERSGDLVTRLVGDVGMVKEVTISAIMPLISSLLVLAGMLAVMIWLNAALAGVILAMLPVLVFMTVRRSKKIQIVARENRKREGAMAATASESIVAIKTVQSLAIHESFNNQFSEHNNATQKQGAKVAKMSAALERSVDVMVAFGTAVALWFGATLVMNGKLSPGELLVFLFYLKRGFRPMRDLAKYSARMAKASAAAERVLEILNSVARSNDDRCSKIAPKYQGRVQFSGVKFRYSDGDAGIEVGDLNINAGETVLIGGPSGSGKTTLSNLLLRLYEPQQGCIRIDGKNISEYTLDSHRNQFNVVLQDGLLFSASIRENIALVRPEATDDEVVAAAKFANAHEFIMALPEGYDTIVRERGSTISRGQSQRIAIARAAIRAAPILILDEPTTGLDAANIEAVTKSIRRLSRGATTFLVSHYWLEGVAIDRFIVVEDGIVVDCSGDSDKLAALLEPANSARGAA